MHCEYCLLDLPEETVRNMEGKNICDACARVITNFNTKNVKRTVEVLESEFVPCPYCNYRVHPKTTVCPNCSEQIKFHLGKTVRKTKASLSEAKKNVRGATSELIDKANDMPFKLLFNRVSRFSLVLFRMAKKIFWLIGVVIFLYSIGSLFIGWRMISSQDKTESMINDILMPLLGESLEVTTELGSQLMSVGYLGLILYVFIFLVGPLVTGKVFNWLIRE